MLGANLGLTSSLDVMDGNDACNRLGIDTISGGAAFSIVCELLNMVGFLSIGRTIFMLHSTLADTSKVMLFLGNLEIQNYHLWHLLC